MKLVYNACFGGFSLSAKACDRYREISGGEMPSIHFDDLKRNDPILVKVVEELGDEAGGRFSKLRITDIPSGCSYRIDEYDGFESVMTKEDYTWEVAE